MATPFLTSGRQAFVTRLQADATLAAAVRTWHVWGAGILRRTDVKPTDCPAVSVTPLPARPEPIDDVFESLPQGLEVSIVTDGADLSPCEELAAAVLDVAAAAHAGLMGLQSAGLVGVHVTELAWRWEDRPNAARVRWIATITVRLNWLRTTT